MNRNVTKKRAPTCRKRVPVPGTGLQTMFCGKVASPGSKFCLAHLPEAFKPGMNPHVSIERVCCQFDGCEQVIDRPKDGIGPEVGSKRFCATHAAFMAGEARAERAAGLRELSDFAMRGAAAQAAVDALGAGKPELTSHGIVTLMAKLILQEEALLRDYGGSAQYGPTEVNGETWDELVQLAKKVRP